MKRSKNLHIALVALTSFATMSFTGCKDQPDEYKSTSGKPEELSPEDNMLGWKEPSQYT